MYHFHMTDSNKNLIGYLVSDFTLSVRDPLWSDMLFTPALNEIIMHPVMQKLSNIKQLGPVSLLYPGAVHTRLAHSLGVCNISRLMLISMLRSSNVKLTMEGINSMLCAAMLHDIGHFPYAHSLKDIVLRSHESLATDIIQNSTSLKKLIKNAGADVDTVCSIISPKDINAKDDQTIFYQRVLSGALDPDKLDYLCRDAYYCGVPYGVQDVSYIVQHIIACDNRPALSFSNAASIEHLLFSKYLMYKNVYWHKSTRSATSMVKQAVKCAIKDNIIDETDLYFLDDIQFTALCKNKNYQVFNLVSLVQDNRLFFCNYSVPINKNTDKARNFFTQQVKKLLPEECKDYNIIVDIPEPISFETDLLLLDSDGSRLSFKDTDELFCKSDVASHFTSSLRKLRIFTPYKTVFTTQDLGAEDFLKEIL